MQSPTHVVFNMETIHDARVIPVDGHPHLSDQSRSGWATRVDAGKATRWWWTTKGFSSKSNFQGSSSGLHLVERFTRIAADTLQYDATMSDPATWTKPWTARLYFKRTDEPLLEYACHEGNLGMHGILSGARKIEAQAKELSYPSSCSAAAVALRAACGNTSPGIPARWRCASSSVSANACDPSFLLTK